MNEFNITTEFDFGDEFRIVLQTKIREFNNATSPHHLEIRKKAQLKQSTSGLMMKMAL
ncbi:hypothetical protein [Desulfosporosinus sp. SB140]|uniref:hypothetical protein n=1 Tax=Desulfosporosinus paludis TaxID=3115649 RepID=UPI00388F6BDE